MTWGVVLAGLLAAAAVVAAPAQRLRLGLVALASVAFIAVYATTYLTSGFDEFYGRYALPALVVLPLCAGAILADRNPKMTASTRRPLVVVLAAGTAAIQLLAWWLAARRLAVGTEGPFFFLGDASWTPPGGWELWVAAMLAGTALYVSVALSRTTAPTP